MVAGRGRQPLIRHALDAGTNFFDTANLYSPGSSEEILGRALHDHADRDEVVICTKVRYTMRDGANGGGLSRKAIMTEIDHSLRRLGTDYVDVYMIHRLDNASEGVGKAAGNRGVSRAQVALAWLRHRPVVAAPLAGASSTAQIDDTVASPRPGADGRRAGRAGAALHAAVRLPGRAR